MTNKCILFRFFAGTIFGHFLSKIVHFRNLWFYLSETHFRGHKFCYQQHSLPERVRFWVQFWALFRGQILTIFAVFWGPVFGPILGPLFGPWSGQGRNKRAPRGSSSAFKAQKAACQKVLKTEGFLRFLGSRGLPRGPWEAQEASQGAPMGPKMGPKKGPKNGPKNGPIFGPHFGLFGRSNSIDFWGPVFFRTRVGLSLVFFVIFHEKTVRSRNPSFCLSKTQFRGLTICHKMP